MSLKAFHIVFVAASIILAFGFGVWSLLAYKTIGSTLYLAMGLGSLATGLALIFYGKAVLKKLKHISYL